MSKEDKSNNDYNKPTEHKEVRTLVLSIATALFAVTFFDVLWGFKKIITPGISDIYNALGTIIQPNMVTLVVFDWRSFDTLGEALILVTAVVVVLLVFGRGLVETKVKNNINEVNEDYLEDD